MNLVDTHSHIDVPEFDGVREGAIERARAAGVRRQVVPAVDAAGWPALRSICAEYPGLYAAYGLHPMYLDHHRDTHLTALREWVDAERPVAVGECGLDFYVDGLDRQRQAQFFDAQLRIARDFDLPVIIHARRAVDAVLAAIRRVGSLRGVVHSFGGSMQQARMLADAGFLLGIGGPVTYERANRLRSIAAQVPLEWLVLETDSPDQPDALHRGQRNEPSRLMHVLDTLARLRGEAVAHVAAATTSNAERLFALPPAAVPASRTGGPDTSSSCDADTAAP